MGRWLIVLLPLLGGCSSWYGFVGAGYQIDPLTDQLLQTSQPWQCSNPSAHFGAGFRANEHVTFELRHDSWYLCNSKETYEWSAEATYYFGPGK